MAKSLHYTFLTLTVLSALVLTASVYYGNWASDYESWDANKKMNYLWTNIMKDTTESSFPSIFQLGQLAAPESLGGTSLMTVGTTYSDQIPKDRIKGIHTSGLVAKVKFNFNAAKVKSLGLTGGWTESVDMIARASSAAQPTDDNNIPNIVVKHLRKGVLSGNIFAGHGLKQSVVPSFFDKPLSNHVPNRYGSFSFEGVGAAFVNWVFAKGPLFHGITGLAEFAQYTSDGKKADKVMSPFAWVINPTPAIKAKCNGVKIDSNNYGCFKDIPAGTPIWDVWVVMDAIEDKNLKQSDLHYLGTMDSVTKWTTSKFGDLELYFKHQFWEDELKMRPDVSAKWSKIKTDYEGCFMDTEGPEKYKKFLVKNRLRRMHAKY